MDETISSSLFDSFFEPVDLNSEVSKLQISFDERMIKKSKIKQFS